MGLIKFVGDVVGGGLNALGNTANAMLWKEYFVSGDMSNGVLMKRAEKVTVNGSKNTRSDENLISSGSGIDVQEGQCMIIVDNGRIVEFCAEAGRYTYDTSSQPSCFYGQNKGLKAVGKEILNQWAAGGQRFSTQRIYFINTGFIHEPLLWGLGNVGFTHTFQPNANIAPIRRTFLVKCRGSINVHIGNPVEFYKQIGAQKAGGDNDGLISMTSLQDTIFAGVKIQINKAVNTALSKVSSENVVAYTNVMAFSDKIEECINSELADLRLCQCGFEFFDWAIDGNPELKAEDYQKLTEMEEKYNMVSDPLLASYDIQKGMVGALHAAGENGGAQGLMGIGMGMNMTGMGGMGNFANFQQPQQPIQQAPATPATPVAAVAPTTPTQSVAEEDSWTCVCGAVMTGKFCHECGAKKPEPKKPEIDMGDTWTCVCGHVSEGKFCPECGAKKPEKKVLKCDKCGWIAPEGTVVKFCPECGDIINESDFE